MIATSSAAHFPPSLAEEDPLDEPLPLPWEREIRSIYQRSPVYGRRFPLHPEPLRWSCYRSIPVLTKREIVDSGHCAFFEDCRALDAAVQRQEFEYERTSGSTAQPMTVVMEAGWWAEQTARAYRAHPLLEPFAGRSVRKAVLAPVACSSNLCPYSDFEFPQRFIDNTAYLNLSSDPFAFSEAEWGRILLELQAVKPEILEGEPTYLALLAREALRAGVRLPILQRIILTYGKASRQHGARIAQAFPAPQVDLCGSTEAGYLYVGEAFADDARPVEENAFFELASLDAENPGLFQVRVTTRRRRAMPLLRYDTRDIVKAVPEGMRVLGRERDLFRRTDGGLVSSYEIDASFPADFACWHYQLVQRSASGWEFSYVADASAPEGLDRNLAAVLGGGARVTLFRKRRIAPSASGKFNLLNPLGGSQPD